MERHPVRRRTGMKLTDRTMQRRRRLPAVARRRRSLPRLAGGLHRRKPARGEWPGRSTTAASQRPAGAPPHWRLRPGRGIEPDPSRAAPCREGARQRARLLPTRALRRGDLRPISRGCGRPRGGPSLPHRRAREAAEAAPGPRRWQRSAVACNACSRLPRRARGASKPSSPRCAEHAHESRNQAFLTWCAQGDGHRPAICAVSPTDRRRQGRTAAKSGRIWGRLSAGWHRRARCHGASHLLGFGIMSNPVALVPLAREVQPRRRARLGEAELGPMFASCWSTSRPTAAKEPTAVTIAGRFSGPAVAPCGNCAPRSRRRHHSVTRREGSPAAAGACTCCAYSNRRRSHSRPA